MATAPDPRRDRGALVAADMRAPRGVVAALDWPYGQTRSRPDGRCRRAPQEDGAEGTRGTRTHPAHPHATAVSARRGDAAHRSPDQPLAGPSREERRRLAA